MTPFLPLIDWLQGSAIALFWWGFLCFVRIASSLALMPAFGELVLPIRVRLALAIALTMIVAPAIAEPIAPGIPEILAESTTGLAMGAGFRMLVACLQTAGAMAAQSVSLSQIFATAGAEPQSAVSNLLLLAALALMCTTGLHLRLVEALILSYALIPMGTFPDAADMAAWGAARVSQAFGLAFTLAAPFVVGGLLYTMALGAINRAMPMLMVVMIGAPALSAGGLILLALTAPVMLTVWIAAWSDFMAQPFDIGP